MKRFFSSLFSAIIGGAVVFAAMNYVAPPKAGPVKEIVRTRTVALGSSDSRNTLTPQEIYERYSDAVVHVRAAVKSNYDDFFGLGVPDNQVASGSGFIVSNDGYVITNAHVVQGADSIKISLSDEAEVPAKLVGVDQSTDLALLKADLSGHRYKVLALGDSGTVKVGEPVYAIGNPLGLDRSLSGGLVSALNREIKAPNGFPIRGVIQTDTAINRGNSGGPLISAAGKVVGVTAQIATEGAGNIGIAFAIPGSTVKKVFSEIKNYGKATHPWIGIQGANLFPAIAKELKLKVQAGAMIVAVYKPGPAEQADLKSADKTLRLGVNTYEVGGDIIIKVNGIKISSMDDLVREINRHRVGDEIGLTVVSAKNQTRVVKIKLGERPQNAEVQR